MKHRLISFIVILSLLLSFAACAKDSVRCLIYYPVYDEMTSLDPQIAQSDAEKIIVTNCFEGLVRVDENGEIVPAAAESWTVSPDGLTYTFTLRRDAKWNLTDYTYDSMKELLPADFAPAVTADDFVFALQRAIDPATGAPDAYLLYAIENARQISNATAPIEMLGVRAVSDYKLEITLSEPQSNFLYVLTECICMPCNRTFFEACGGRYGMKVRYYMSNGPFHLYSFADGDFTLDASDEYNGPHMPVPASVYLYYNKNGATVPDRISSEFYSAAYLTDSMYAATKVEKSATVTELENTTVGLIFNQQHEILKNANVRKAIAFATDTQGIAELADRSCTDSLVPSICGFTPACKNVYNEEKALATLLQGFEELSQPQVVVVPVEPEETPADDSESELAGADTELTDTQPTDTVQTEEQIVEVEEVTAIELTVLTSEEYADVIKRQMQNWQRILGLRCVIRIETVNDATLRSRVTAGDYEMAFCPISVHTPDALSFLQYFTADNPDNCIFLEDENYVKLIDSAMATDNRAQQEQYITAAADYLQENGCIIPVFSESAYLVQTTGVSGIYCYTGPDRVYFSNAFSEN